jgi:hypothetical protein
MRTRAELLEDELVLEIQDRALQDKSELVALKQMMLGIKPEVVVEVGLAYGGSLAHWVDLNPKLLIGIDVNFLSLRESVEEILSRRLSAKGGRYYSFIAPSQSDITAEGVGILSRIYGSGIDFIFIDGDHTHHGVERDYQTYLDLMNPRGGTMAFHDIRGEAGVAKLWEQLSRQYESTEFCFSGHDYGIGVITIGERR